MSPSTSKPIDGLKNVSQVTAVLLDHESRIAALESASSADPRVDAIEGELAALKAALTPPSPHADPEPLKEG